VQFEKPGIKHMRLAAPTRVPSTSTTKTGLFKKKRFGSQLEKGKKQPKWPWKARGVERRTKKQKKKGRSPSQTGTLEGTPGNQKKKKNSKGKCFLNNGQQLFFPQKPLKKHLILAAEQRRGKPTPTTNDAPKGWTKKKRCKKACQR